MPIHGSLFQEFREKETQDPFSLQNKKLLRIDMRYGEVWARTGSMVAYQGDVRFANKGSGGLGKMLKAAATGEGVKMMQCSGHGELFVADQAAEVQVMYLENDMISVNGANVLAFSASIEWDIHRVNAGRASMMAGGLFSRRPVAVWHDAEDKAVCAALGSWRHAPLNAMMDWTPAQEAEK